MGLEAADGGEGEVGEGGLEGEGGYIGVGAEGVGLEALRRILRVERGAYKPDWVDMFLFLRLSKTLELFGIYRNVQFVVCETGNFRRTCTSKP